MTRLRRTVLASLIAASAALLGGLAVAQSIQQEQRALLAAKRAVAEAEARARALQERAEAEKGEAERARAEAAAVAARIQAAEADMDAAETRIRLIDQLRAEQSARLADRQEPAVRLIAALQMMARRPPALGIVQPGSTTDLVHVRAMLATMVPELRRRTAGLRSEILRSRQLRADAAKALALLDAGKARLGRERAALVALSAQRQAQSDRLASGALLEQDRAMAMGERARDIVELIDQIAVDAGQRDELASLPGPLLRPERPGAARLPPPEQARETERPPTYRLPVQGTVLAGLGEVSGAGVRARGLTLATRPSAQVVAPTAGRIVFAGAFRRYGNIVIIDHGRSWTTLITNLARLDVRVGDEVAQGGPIGQAGVEDPKVTVELRKAGRAIDITPLIG
jgi:septal ring factor EnvC (AmiA/AmiB activator)